CKRAEVISEDVFFQAEDGIRGGHVTGVQTCALPISIASRIAYAAAHVVADPLADVDPTTRTAIDWDATLAYRRHLWASGLAVARSEERRVGKECGCRWARPAWKDRGGGTSGCGRVGG